MRCYITAPKKRSTQKERPFLLFPGMFPSILLVFCKHLSFFAGFIVRIS